MPVSEWWRVGILARPVVDCAAANWRHILQQHVSEMDELDIINFDFDLHGPFCETAAANTPMEFRPDRDPATRRGSLRKRWK